MIFYKKLPDFKEIKEKLNISNELINKRLLFIDSIKKILSGNDNRKIICIGPCSADSEKSVLEYMNKLAKISDDLKDKFLFIPRIYTSKPRTKGIGYMGLLHTPDLYSNVDSICDGVIASRMMHLKVINETGLFGVDEILYPELMLYIGDLLVYGAIGARSVEDQSHRIIASGMDFPIGMKNPTSGDYSVLLNSIYAAQISHDMLYSGWAIKTEGNKFAHAILRGYTDRNSNNHPNYHFEDLCDFYDLYIKSDLKNMSVLVDCSHSNARKRYDEQIRISKEVLLLCKEYNFINKFVKGLFIESYLVDGSQKIGENIYGKSITDPCLGWEKTERLLYDLVEIL